MAKTPNTGGVSPKKTTPKKKTRVAAPNVGTGTGTLRSQVRPMAPTTPDGTSFVSFDSPADRTARNQQLRANGTAGLILGAIRGAVNGQTAGLPARMHPSARATTLPQVPATGGTPAPAPVDPLTDAATKAADLVYGGQIRDVNQQIGESPQRQANISGWFQQYLDTLKSTQARQDAIFEASSNPMNHEIATDDMSDTAKAALANRNALGDSFTGMMRAERGSAGEAAKAEYDAGAESRLGYHLAEDRDTGKLRSQLQGLLTDKGNYASTYKTQQANTDRQYGLDVRAADRADLQAKTERDTLAATIGKTLTDDQKAQAEFTAKTGLSMSDLLDGITPKERHALVAFNNQKNGRKPNGQPFRQPTKPSDKIYPGGRTRKEWLALPVEQRQKLTEKFGGNNTLPGKTKAASKVAGDRNGDGKVDNRDLTPSELLAKTKDRRSLRKSRLREWDRIRTAVQDYRGSEGATTKDPDGKGPLTGHKASHTERLAAIRSANPTAGKYTNDELLVAMAMNRYERHGSIWSQDAISAARRLGIKPPPEQIRSHAPTRTQPSNTPKYGGT